MRTASLPSVIALAFGALVASRPPMLRHQCAPQVTITPLTDSAIRVRNPLIHLRPTRSRRRSISPPSFSMG